MITKYDMHNLAKQSSMSNPTVIEYIKDVENKIQEAAQKGLYSLTMKAHPDTITLLDYLQDKGFEARILMDSIRIGW